MHLACKRNVLVITSRTPARSKLKEVDVHASVILATSSARFPRLRSPWKCRTRRLLVCRLLVIGHTFAWLFVCDSNVRIFNVSLQIEQQIIYAAPDYTNDYTINLPIWFRIIWILLNLEIYPSLVLLRFHVCKSIWIS